MAAEVHPTAIVEPGAQLGDGVRIWHWVHVRAAASIGAGTSIGQGCYLGAVSIGRGCRIQNHVSLFDGVTLEDDVFLGPSCVFTNVKHPRAHVARKHAYAPTRIHRGASIGANATILCGISIGAYALIGAGAVVSHDVPAHALMLGTPARRTGWACRCGETLPGRTLASALLSCASCGDVYSASDTALALVTP
ncbi:MAG TPA: acyltransferase [Kofleriaceae bacterium]|jgi:UDP-2-acetamido-3-amino-2,3-dideoxy-glucuronate N-acetyltransferase|nr:acyltransferase [Kofleriaceae bacterium]